MIIENVAPEPYEVEDFSFTFANGLVVPITVARDLGDTIDWDTNPMAVKFEIAAKPSAINPDATLAPGDVTILMQHVIMVEHRKRLIQPPTHEEKDRFHQTLLKASNAVH